MTAWYTVAAGFLLFRGFDIIKVPPASQIDRDWTEAAGILFDDLVSGLYFRRRNMGSVVNGAGGRPPPLSSLGFAIVLAGLYGLQQMFWMVQATQ
jgi:hypothetical protein